MNSPKLRLFLLISLSNAIPMIASADIYKCMQPDGTPLFQTECPEGTVSSKKIKVREASDLGFGPVEANDVKVGQNILANGDFESEVEKWEVRGSAETLDREGIKGTTALRLATAEREKTKTRLRQCLPTKGIGELSVTAFVKQEGALTPESDELRIVSFTSDDCTAGGEYNAQINPTAAPGWQKLEKNGVSPSLGARSLLVEVTHDNDSAEPTYALWDEIEITVTKVESASPKATTYSQYTRPIGENHLINGDFAANLDHWQTGWTAEWNQYSGHEVSGGAHIKANSDYGKKIRGEALSQCINFGTNKNFKVGVSFKQDSLSSQKGSGMMRLAWMQEIDCAGKQQLGGSYITLNSSGWQNLEGDVVAPDGSQSVLIRMYQTVDDTGMYGAFWDDAYFIAK